jgi:hypothetical protein
VEHEEIMSLSEFTAWMTEHGVKRSREEWYRRMAAGQFGRKIGHQWTATLAEARELVESFATKDP